MVDDDFIDYFIAQSEEYMKGAATYWVAQEQNSKELKKVQSPLVNPVGWTKKTIPFLAEEANHYDKLVLHSFFFSNLGSFLQALRKDIELIWMFWGGDGYNFTANDKQWYQPLTWQYKKEALKENSNTLKSIFRDLNTSKLRWKKSAITKKLIRRVNICATWVKYDYEMIRHINPQMKWTYYSYFTSYQMRLHEIEFQPLNRTRLWLGNSATDTNNHFDALHYLKEINWQGEIMIPLSYGSKKYAQDIIAYGKEHFGDKLIPLTELIPLDQYHQYMNTCGIVWMNHIRQQAAGNTLAALYMGKAVIMNSKNNLYKTLKDWGIHFIEKEILKRLEDIRVHLFQSNKTVIESNLSHKENLAAIEKIYSY